MPVVNTLRVAATALLFAVVPGRRERTTKLVAEKFAPPQQLDAANDALDVANAKVEQTRQNLSLLREGARKGSGLHAHGFEFAMMLVLGTLTLSFCALRLR
jgi:hypothetical protein